MGIAARREERLKELKDQYPANIATKRIDVTQPDAAQRFTELIELCDGMDVLLFAAGIGSKDAEVRFCKSSGKCRANKAVIEEIIGDFCGEKVGISIHDRTTEYYVGDKVYVEDFDRSDEECSTGFHFFRTKEEAEAY